VWLWCVFRLEKRKKARRKKEDNIPSCMCVVCYVVCVCVCVCVVVCVARGVCVCVACGMCVCDSQEWPEKIVLRAYSNLGKSVKRR